MTPALQAAEIGPAQERKRLPEQRMHALVLRRFRYPPANMRRPPSRSTIWRNGKHHGRNHHDCRSHCTSLSIHHLHYLLKTIVTLYHIQPACARPPSCTYLKSLRRQNRNSQATKTNRATAKAVSLTWTISIPAVDKRIPHVAKIFPRVASHEFWRQNSVVLAPKLP